MLLRDLEMRDVDGMLEWMHDADIQKGFQKNMLGKTRIDAENFIRSATLVPEYERESIHFAIADSNDEYLGTISLKHVDRKNKNAEYAVVLRKKAQSKNIGYSATMQILEYAFKNLDLERVYLHVLSDNISAIKMYERSGFIFEGESRNHLFLNGEFKNLKNYSILKSEFI